MGFWKWAYLLYFSISYVTLGIQGAPHPQAQETEEEFRRNYAVEYGAPLISPLREYIILEMYTEYVIRCEASWPIIWKCTYPLTECPGKNFDTLDPKRPYGKELHLTNVTHFNVGNYFCVDSSHPKNITNMDDSELFELVNNNHASSIYIYVNDPNNLLVEEIPFISAIQYQDVIIPCKPTMPTVDVLLTTPNGETFSSESTGRFDPQRGFVVEIRGIFDSGTYICRPKIPSPQHEDETKAIEIFFVGNEPITQLDKSTVEVATPTATTTKTIRKPSRATPPTTKKTAKTKTTTTSATNLTKSTVTNNIVNVINRIVVLTTTPIVNKIDVDVGGMDNNVNINVDGDGVGIGIGVGDNHVNIGEPYHATTTKTTTTNANSNSNFTTIKFYEATTASNTVTADSIATTTAEDNSDGSNDFHNENDAIVKRASAYTTPSHRMYSNHYRNTPRPDTKYMEKPVITSTSNGHVIEGGSFTLNCYVKVPFDVKYEAMWKIPDDAIKNRTRITDSHFYNHTDTHNFGVSTLTVENAKKTDSGSYNCSASDYSKNEAHNTYLMTVLSPGEEYINISEPSGYYKIVGNANKKVQINVKYRGFPMPTLTWLKPDKTEINNGAKFMVNTTETSTTLQIMDAQLEDSGQYVIHATNGLVTKELEFNVSIMDKPKVTVEDVYVQAGEEAHVTCRVLAYPPAIVSWVFSKCDIKPRWPACDKRFEQTFNSTSNARSGQRSIEYLHDMYFTPESPGLIRCVAQNTKGISTGKGHVLISDIKDNMTVYGVDENKKIARGDELEVTCAALTYFFTDDLNWYKENELVTNSDNIQIITSSSDYSYKKTLKFKSVGDHDRGSYECRARHANNYDNYDSKYTDIFVHEPLTPRMIYSNLDSSTKLKRKLGEPLELECEAEAIPLPSIDWYKDDVQLNTTDNLEIVENGKKLYVKYMKPEDDGVYKCIAANRLGVVERSAKVEITNLPGLALGWIFSIITFILILIALVIYLFVRIRRERKMLRELKAAGLANFEEGAVEHINPALTLDEQADLLPYDRCFEFPREKLKLGKQLGAGAFGVVLKAHAEGIKPDEKETTVAVKMVKRTADNEVMRALVSELKIMVHLGQHLNVVNLLGAVTKNIAKRELMVIVEYCRYGNVQNFLLKNRKRFINQINPDTGKIDPNIKTQRFSDNFEMNRNSDNDPRSGTRAGRPNSTGYLRHSDLYEGHVDSGATEQTVMTTIPEDDDHIMSNNSIQPAWRSNYKSDTTEAMTITTSDLVSWGFQVARGMDYLSSRKVLHGDLAARNILLCENNVVKICDFGLARSMYKSDNYKKQGEAPLPIKWLALESLSDHIFSTYTDVWSFGIVLWEFFSLAKVPYPGMDPNQSLYLKLKDGYRMEKPAFANDELYDIMLECWSTNPESRPLFNELEKRFARMLGDDVTNHYVDLNETYLRTTNEYMKRNPTDYLSLMGSPDEEAPPPPRYVNGHILPEIRIDPSSSDDYLQMSTNTDTAIFSPTRPKDPNSTSDDPNTAATTSFTFPDTAPQQHSPTLVNNLDSPVNKNRRKEGIQPEEIPMLHSAHHNSDGESSPEQSRKFANILQQTRSTPTPSPRHHVAETELTGDDNYVNVKSPKKTLNNNGARAPDAFSNPSYQMLKTVKEGDVGNK